MKRTRLARKTPLARSKPPKRGSGLKPGRRRERPVLSAETASIVHVRQGGKCACGCGQKIAAGPIGWHHALPKHLYPELIDVAENVVGVAATCHANHESGSRRLPRSAVMPVEGLILTGPMRAYLDRIYGPRD